MLDYNQCEVGISASRNEKNSKRVAYICIILNIVLLLQICLGTVIAVEDTASEPEQIVEEAVIAAHDGEIQVMAASGCKPTCDHTMGEWSYGSAYVCVMCTAKGGGIVYHKQGSRSCTKNCGYSETIRPICY